MVCRPGPASLAERDGKVNASEWRGSVFFAKSISNGVSSGIGRVRIPAKLFGPDSSDHTSPKLALLLLLHSLFRLSLFLLQIFWIFLMSKLSFALPFARGMLPLPISVLFISKALQFSFRSLCSLFFVFRLGFCSSSNFPSHLRNKERLFQVRCALKRFI